MHFLIMKSKWRRKRYIDSIHNKNSQDMNYGAGNVTQCDADVPDVQSTQYTAGRVWACPTERLWSFAAARTGMSEPEERSTFILRGFPSVQTTLSTHKTQGTVWNGTATGLPHYILSNQRV